MTQQYDAYVERLAGANGVKQREQVLAELCNEYQTQLLAGSGKFALSNLILSIITADWSTRRLLGGLSAAEKAVVARTGIAPERLFTQSLNPNWVMNYRLSEKALLQLLIEVVEYFYRLNNANHRSTVVINTVKQMLHVLPSNKWRNAVGVIAGFQDSLVDYETDDMMEVSEPGDEYMVLDMLERAVALEVRPAQNSDDYIVILRLFNQYRGRALYHYLASGAAMLELEPLKA